MKTSFICSNNWNSVAKSKLIATIEFLKLCQNLELTPTFAKVDQTKSTQWKGSAKTFEENVVKEIHQKTKRLTNFRKENDKVYNEISEKCPPLRIVCIMRMIITLCKESMSSVHEWPHKKDLETLQQQC